MNPVWSTRRVTLALERALERARLHTSTWIGGRRERELRASVIEHELRPREGVRVRVSGG